MPPQGGRKHPHQEFLQIDTTNMLFLCGGAFSGLEHIIESRVGKKKPAQHFTLVIDTLKNEPVIKKDTEADWGDKAHGTRVEIELEAVYQKGRRSVDDYIEQTALANPHASIRYVTPKD